MQGKTPRQDTAAPHSGWRLMLRPKRFPEDVEREFLENRAEFSWTLLKWAAVGVAPQYLIIGAWDEMIDPGSLDETWMIRVAMFFGYLIFAAVVWRGSSVRALVMAWWTGFAMSAIGFGLIVNQVEGGFFAGAAAFAVPIGLVALSLTNVQALVSIAILIGIPAATYGIAGATGPQIGNLVVWLASGGALAYVVFRTADVTRRRAFVAEQDLEVERSRSEALLRNVLPEQIAERLKGDQTTIADQFEGISVLFADIVGFTPLSQEMSPEATVRMLNDLFSKFDEIVARHDVEKIRTIGDNYMVVAGAPRPMRDHAPALAAVALEIRDCILGSPPFDGRRIDFRIGINSGPAVGGVIGTSKFQYDVWGDTVNTAARMEMQGVAGRIQITRATHDLLDGEFECSLRGTIDVKGKGPMETWFLEGRRG